MLTCFSHAARRAASAATPRARRCRLRTHAGKLSTRRRTHNIAAAHCARASRGRWRIPRWTAAVRAAGYRAQPHVVATPATAAWHEPREQPDKSKVRDRRAARARRRDARRRAPGARPPPGRRTTRPTRPRAPPLAALDVATTDSRRSTSCDQMPPPPPSSCGCRYSLLARERRHAAGRGRRCCLFMWSASRIHAHCGGVQRRFGHPSASLSRRDRGDVICRPRALDFVAAIICHAAIAMARRRDDSTRRPAAHLRGGTAIALVEAVVVEQIEDLARRRGTAALGCLADAADATASSRSRPCSQRLGAPRSTTPCCSGRASSSSCCSAASSRSRCSPRMSPWPGGAHPRDRGAALALRRGRVSRVGGPSS